jgi:hypothetical protein
MKCTARPQSGGNARGHLGQLRGARRWRRQPGVRVSDRQVCRRRCRRGHRRRGSCTLSIGRHRLWRLSRERVGATRRRGHKRLLNKKTHRVGPHCGPRPGIGQGLRSRNAGPSRAIFGPTCATHLRRNGDPVRLDVPRPRGLYSFREAVLRRTVGVGGAHELAPRQPEHHEQQQRPAGPAPRGPGEGAVRGA